MPEEDGVGYGAGLESRTRCHPIRVLVLYDDSALAFDPNIVATSRRVVTGVNDILRVSGAFSSQVSFQVANVLPFNINQTGDPENDRDFMETNNTVSDLRTTNAADLILYFVNASWGGVLGIANLAEDGTRVVAMVDASVILTRVSAHELGHLLSCRHESAADPTGPFEHAYDFKTGCKPFRSDRNTIMWSALTNNVINRFSNPLRTYKDEPYGTTVEDNVRQLRARGCAVASYDDNNGPPIVTAFIDGPDLLCACTQDDLTVQVSCPPGLPLTFEWRQSSDGINYGPVYGTSETVSVSAPCVEGEIFWYRVQIFDANGQLLTTSVKSIMANPFWVPGPNACQQLILSREERFQRFFPAVSSGVFTLELNDLKLSDELVFTVTSSSGASFVSNQSVDPGSQHTFQFNFSDLLPGMYLLTSQRTKPVKFIKL